MRHHIPCIQLPQRAHWRGLDRSWRSWRRCSRSPKVLCTGWTSGLGQVDRRTRTLTLTPVGRSRNRCSVSVRHTFPNLNPACVSRLHAAWSSALLLRVAFARRWLQSPVIQGRNEGAALEKEGGGDPDVRNAEVGRRYSRARPVTRMGHFWLVSVSGPVIARWLADKTGSLAWKQSYRSKPGRTAAIQQRAACSHGLMTEWFQGCFSGTSSLTNKSRGLRASEQASEECKGG